jgi:O-antigen biosynthesis protein
MSEPIISVFTPSHNTRWLVDIYKCLQNQTDPNWEWVVLYNNGADPMPELTIDKRVKASYAYNVQPWVGATKAAACALATGDYLLELDHDDLLAPTAIEKAREAFRDPNVGFVYSNCVRCNIDYTKRERFDARYGWIYREVELNGVLLDENVHFEPSPACVSRIWFAPDHFRAFRRSVYESIGGHSKDMRVLDDLDLMCRMYKASKFHHIDEPLYIYRVHGENTWLKNNQEIQDNVLRIHDQYFPDLCEKWASDNGLRCLELGGRLNAKEGFETVDLRDANIIANLDERWPFEDNSVGCVRAFDVFEHLKNPIHTIMELYRVLAPGGYALIQVPSTDGRGAFQDPTHVSFWNENSFAYYTDARMNRYIDCPVRFQSVRRYTTDKDAGGVCWTIAHLMKLGDFRVPGEVLI